MRDDLNRLPGETTITREVAAPVGLGKWDAGDDDAPIPPRGWLLGNAFCRKFVSSLLADGGVGKTALRIAQYLFPSRRAERSPTNMYSTLPRADRVP